jgi:hypothetical protein
MKNYSLLIKLVVGCALLAYCTLGLMPARSYAQGRRLTQQQVDAIVQPSLAQCSNSSVQTTSVQTTSVTKIGQTRITRLDPASIIPTANAVEFSTTRIAKTMHGMWRGEVYGDYNKNLKVDYFWIMDTNRKEGLIIAQRTGHQSTAGMQPVPNAPKISYLMCAHEGYIPSSEGGAQLHEFVKVSNGIESAPAILKQATGLNLTGLTTLSDMWQAIVASGYFQSLPAVAFAGALFKPIRIEPVPGATGPSQVSLSWDAEYYGGGATQLKFQPGIPMKGVEYTTFVGASATSGDYLVASPGNGSLSKVEASSEEACAEEACWPEFYDLAFDSVTMGPLQQEAIGTPQQIESPQQIQSQSPRSQPKTGNRKNNQHKLK